MKKILFTLVLTAFLFNCETPEQNKYNENEIIYVVEMDANEGKSEDDIAKFSQYYTDAIDNTEPNSLGWGFYNSGDKVILIERYLDENAIMEHSEASERYTDETVASLGRLQNSTSPSWSAGGISDAIFGFPA